jgi:hypothetical protein
MHKITLTFDAYFLLKDRVPRGVDETNPEMLIKFWARDSLINMDHEILGPEGEVIATMQVGDVLDEVNVEGLVNRE